MFSYEKENLLSSVSAQFVLRCKSDSLTGFSPFFLKKNDDVTCFFVRFSTPNH